MYKQPKIPGAKRQGAKVRVYTDYGGVDLSGDASQVRLNRSPFSVNMFKNYAAQLGACVETRPGFRRVAHFDGAIYGDMFYASGEGQNSVRVVHAGSRLYRWEGGEYPNDVKTELYTDMEESRSVYFVYGKKLYVGDGRNYLRYDGTAVRPVREAAYIPTTSIGRAPEGGGTALNPVNLLQPARRNSFTGDGVSAVYALDATGLDDSPVTAEIAGEPQTEGADFTVNRPEGTIAWKSAPPPPGTIGQDNVTVTFSKTVPDYAGRVENCALCTLFDSRVFFTGNPAYPNAVFHSMLDDPTYVSDLSYYKDGADDAPIMSLLRIGDTLAAVKADNMHDSTVYYHAPRLDETLGKIYPAAQGLAGRGCYARYAAGNYRDDPVFLSRLGVEAIGKMDVTLERAIQHRSSLVDGRLVNEPELRDAYMEEWLGYLLLLVGGRIYLADERQRYLQEATAHSEYEWYLWDNIGVWDGQEIKEPARGCEGGTFSPACILSQRDGALYFGTGNGYLCRFNTDMRLAGTTPGSGTASGELAPEAYNDDGRILFSCWTTPHDDCGAPNRYKVTNKRGGAASLKSMISSGVKLKAATNKSFARIVARHNAGYFDFNHINFADFTFNTFTHNGMVYRIREKKWIWISLTFYSDELNKPFGLFSATLEAFIGGYTKAG